MIDRGRHNVLGIRIDAVDYEGAVRRISHAAKRSQPLAVSALAVHGVMTGALDRVHRHRLNKIDLIVPDGQPVRWALNLLHRAHLPDRVCGPNLMLELCRNAAEEDIPIYLFGCDESMLGALRTRLEESFPKLRIVRCRPSKFRTLHPEERQELIDDIKASGAQMVFVGIGCPRQEIFAYEMRDDLPMPLIAVGAAFAFHADRLAKAPLWMQNAGLEWLYRLAMEPRRLWRRYVLLNPLYLTLLGLQKLGIYKIDEKDSDPPKEQICYG
jgi:exopolysaccharide biosynthesis WecB/TagA/CpsF family protein